MKEIQAESSRRKIPLALFNYNRPDHTEAALKALLECHGRDRYDFFFFSDAPRRVADVESVHKVRKVLHSYSSLFEATLIEQSTNQGLAQSIVRGVNHLCSKYGWVVVLEDDLLVEPQFLQFMAEALLAFEHSSGIMQIAGMTLAPPPQAASDAFVLPVTSTWGWGTWQRAWKLFSWEPSDWPQSLTDHSWLSVFQVGGSADYLSMLENALAGRIDSWGILWWYAVSRVRGKVIYPTRTLVQNNGFDGTGVHCGDTPIFHLPRPIHAQGPAWLSDGIIFPSDESVVPSHYLALQSLLKGDSESIPPRSRWMRWKDRLSTLSRRFKRGMV